MNQTNLWLVTTLGAFVGLWVYNDTYRIQTPEYKVEAEVRQESYLATQMENSIEYLRDTTTGICFAAANSGPHGFGFATVDCSMLNSVKVIEFTKASKG